MPPQRTTAVLALLVLCAPHAVVNGYSRPTITVSPKSDWLLEPDPRKASSNVSLVQLDNQTIALTNGLVARVFAISPFFATWDIATSVGSALRGMSDEATVTLDGTTYTIGGGIALLDDGSGTACPLPNGVGPVNNCPTAYFNRSTPYGPNSSSFQYSTHWTSPPEAPFMWKPKRHAPDMPWPPLGLRLSVNLTAPANAKPEHKGIVVTVHYEMYQGIPAMSKWLTITNTGSGKLAKKKKKNSLKLPPDQMGPICIEPCDATLPPSDWESRWLLTPDIQGVIKQNSNENSCLTVSKGDSFHEYNDQLNVAQCNAKDPLQQFLFNSTTGLLQTRATVASISALKGKACSTGGSTYNTTLCAVDVNNHQPDPGTVLQLGALGSVPAAGGLFAEWKLIPDTSGGKSFAIQATNTAYKDRCLWYTPLPPPPAPPPPPPPKAPCVAPDCVILDHVAVEVLRVNAPFAPSLSTESGPSVAALPSNWGLLYPKSTQVHGSEVVWGVDPTFDPNYSGNDGSIQPMLTAQYIITDETNYVYGGPAARLRAPNSNVTELNNPFDTFRTLELYSDSTDDERFGLGVRKLTRLLAPQTSETPLFMHLTDTSPAGLKNAVDEIVTTGGGFDMIIFSFGSGFDLESKDPNYLASVKASVNYANSHGIEIGGYDLIALSRTGTGFDAINPATGQSAGSTCFASGWNIELLKQVLMFINATGLSMVETDGPYGGTSCSATDHDHYGADDSVQKQWENQVEFYKTMREYGVFVHAPDDYIFSGGSNKNCGWYQEMQFSLPRWQHISISHTEVYDHTYMATPTQTWMFAPLLDYHSGGPAAALDPFSKTGEAWEWTLANYIGAGVGACYRGDRLYDTPEVQQMVTKWMKFWVKYRVILTSDIIHVKRPDMQSVDVILHVNANSSDPIAALAMLYNPTLVPQTVASLSLPLYYTGETESVVVFHEETQGGSVTLNRDYSIHMNTTTVQPQGYTYFVVYRN